MYSDIPGRAAYLWLYDQFVLSAPQDAIVVEVGVALGKSIAYLARKCIDAGRKDIRIYAVDPWAGTARNGEQQANGPATPDGDYELFIEQMKKHCPEELERIRIIRKESVKGAEAFSDHTVQLVVLDAAHDYDSVKQDIAVWLPKIAMGGAIGGDDFVDDFPGVKKAVNEAFDGYSVEVRHDEGWGTWRVQL